MSAEADAYVVKGALAEAGRPDLGEHVYLQGGRVRVLIRYDQFDADAPLIYRALQIARRGLYPHGYACWCNNARRQSEPFACICALPDNTEGR